jgi:integrase/recombinase XerD
LVQIILKAVLPAPSEVPSPQRSAAAAAPAVRLREPRPIGFPLLFSADLGLIEPAVAYLHEHAVQRAHTSDTVRTYAEILYDWFETLEQNRIEWRDADAADLIAYRNRMLQEPSQHTQRPYSVRTINHRVRGVLRFYEWAVRNGWLSASSLSGQSADFAVGRGTPSECKGDTDASLFGLRQFVSLPRPLSMAQARELLAALAPPYDLMARWQLYTGLRASELLRLTVENVGQVIHHQRTAPDASHRFIDLVRKGRKNGYVIASASLLEETTGYLSTHRSAWIARAGRRRHGRDPAVLFINSRGSPVSKNRYQQVIHAAAVVCGFKATTHLLRATFACTMLARLDRLAREGAAINPLMIVKVLMGHEHIETTDRYLRAIAADTTALGDVLDSLISETRR